jgi:deoxyribonuclease-1
MLTLALALLAVAVPQTPGSFTTAKKRAMEITADHRQTLYCGCDFTEDGDLKPDRCGYVPRNFFTGSGNVNLRAMRVEWEHVVTAHRMGKDRQCWNNKTEFPTCQRSSGSWLSSRECCRKVDPEFKAMETDLHNLWPAVGELNGDRSNKPIASVFGEPREYGVCDFEVSKRAAEVRPDAQGDVARAYLYMADVWGVPLLEEERVQFMSWNLADPPSEWEIERDKRIARLQGQSNKFVSEHSHVHDGKPCTPRAECCRVCSTSQACGNSCISKSKTCSKDPGCACQRSDLCPE